MDFKNKCNIGYAFINLIEPKNSVINFYNEFHNKKWYLYRSEKVHLIYFFFNYDFFKKKKICEITYARI